MIIFLYIYTYIYLKNIFFLKVGDKSNLNSFNEFDDSANFNMEHKHVPGRISVVTSEVFLVTIVNNGKIIFDFNQTQSLGSYHDHELFYLCQDTNTLFLLPFTRVCLSKHGIFSSIIYLLQLLQNGQFKVCLWCSLKKKQTSKF